MQEGNQSSIQESRYQFEKLLQEVKHHMEDFKNHREDHKCVIAMERCRICNGATDDRDGEDEMERWSLVIVAIVIK